MGKNTLRYGLYATAVVIILALTGIFTKFTDRDVFIFSVLFEPEAVVNLSVVLLTAMLAVTAFIVSMAVREKGRLLTIVNGAVGALVMGLSLGALVLIQNAIGDMRFVFLNFDTLVGGTLTFGYEQDQLLQGLLILQLYSAFVGGFVGLLVSLPARSRSVVFLVLGLTVVIGLLETQIKDMMTLPDALALALAFVLGYVAAMIRRPQTALLRVGIGVAAGILVAIVLNILVTGGALDSFAPQGDTLGRILGGGDGSPLVAFVLIFGFAGLAGSLAVSAARMMHQGAWYILVTLFVVGVLNSQGMMNDIATVVTVLAYGVALWWVPVLGERSEKSFETAEPPQQTTTNRISVMIALVVMLAAPIFLGPYITNVFDTVALYIIMGIGLNVMVGFAGLLDLGYVASFAIGAYTVGLITTPSLITTGCLPVEEVSDYRYFEMCVGLAENWQGIGVLNFWSAWPVAVIVSAFTGMALGIPVLRLRGDYLAIVTLGFGQIVGVMIRSNDFRPLLGGPQGVQNIPVPSIDLSFLNSDWIISFGDATSIYYLYLLAVLLAAFVVYRLVTSRLGRAWRAMRADEDVAQAMGIHLVRTKLLAFGISSAFAGLGGAVFVMLLRGAAPTSFNLDVSINVLSLIIIGGLGSIPGVVVGALVLVGLPEALREFTDYRLLMFGTLLVVVMLIKPEGLLPPRPRRLSEMDSTQLKKGAESDG